MKKDEQADHSMVPMPECEAAVASGNDVIRAGLVAGMTPDQVTSLARLLIDRNVRELAEEKRERKAKAERKRTALGGPIGYVEVAEVGECPLIAYRDVPFKHREPGLAAEQAAIDSIRQMARGG